MLPHLKIPFLIHHLTYLQSEALQLQNEEEARVGVGLAPLEVMVAWVVPYEREPECSFCSSSVEPILERFNDGFNIK